LTDVRALVVASMEIEKSDKQVNYSSTST